MTASHDPVSIQLLADHTPLVPAVGRMRWDEWGSPSETLAAWIDVTAREAGRDRLPVTWVAVDEHGDALGAVGLDQYDEAAPRDRSPWLVGMIVIPDRRGAGIGSRLVARLEAWARAQGHSRLWVATGGPAVDFYRRCGWQIAETYDRVPGELTTLLTRNL